MATLAEVLELSHTQRLPLGSWLDGLESNSRRWSKFPARYVASQTKIWAQFRAKKKVVEAAGQAIGLYHTNYSQPSAWAGPLADAIRAAYKREPQEPGQEERERGHADLCSTSASESSSSPSSSEAVQAVEQAPRVSEPQCDLKWILVRRKLHRSMPDDNGAGLRPQCCRIVGSLASGMGLNDAAEAAEPVERELSPIERWQRTAKWCHRCANYIFDFTVKEARWPGWIPTAVGTLQTPGG